MTLSWILRVPFGSTTRLGAEHQERCKCNIDAKRYSLFEICLDTLARSEQSAESKDLRTMQFAVGVLSDWRCAAESRCARSGTQSQHILTRQQLNHHRRPQQSRSNRDQRRMRSSRRSCRHPMHKPCLSNMIDRGVIRNEHSQPSTARPNPARPVCWKVRVVHARMAFDLPAMRDPHKTQQVQPAEDRCKYQPIRYGSLRNHSQL